MECGSIEAHELTPRQSSGDSVGVPPECLDPVGLKALIKGQVLGVSNPSFPRAKTPWCRLLGREAQGIMGVQSRSCDGVGGALCLLQLPASFSHQAALC